MTRDGAGPVCVVVGEVAACAGRKTGGLHKDEIGKVFVHPSNIGGGVIIGLPV